MRKWILMPQIRHAASAKGYQMRLQRDECAPRRPKSVTCPPPSLTHFLFNDLIGEWNQFYNASWSVEMKRAGGI